MRATLTKVLTKEAFSRMISAAERWTAGVDKVITEFALPWHVTRLGCRAEYQFSPTRPKNGTQAHDAMDFELERFMHLYAMNRGILLTPFHNMALMSPQADSEDVDHHTRVFREAVKEVSSRYSHPLPSSIPRFFWYPVGSRDEEIRLEHSDLYVELRCVCFLRRSGYSHPAFP